MRIILLSGKRFNGKDTINERIKEYYNINNSNVYFVIKRITG